MERPIKALLLPLYLALYDQLRPERRQGLLPFLEDVKAFLGGLGLEVVDPGIVTKPAHVRHAAKLAASADLVITLHLSYSPSLLVADALERMARPILMLDTTKADRFDAKSTATDISENHGIHGVMDLASVLTGRGVPFAVVAGALRDPGFVRRTTDALRVLQAVALFRRQRVGLTGRPFADMGDFAVDFAELKQRFDVTVLPVSVREIMAAGGRVKGVDLAAEVGADHRRCTFHGVDEAAHVSAVRDYLALRAIVAARGLTAYTMNFQQVRQGIATPFYACSRLMADGIGYAGEGDVLTSLLGRPMNHLAGEAFFSEMFCPDWKGGTLLMAHMGEIDTRFGRRDVPPVLAQKKALMNDQPSVYPLPTMAPRDVTIVNLARDLHRGFRLVVAQARIVAFRTQVAFGMPHFKLRPRLPLTHFLEAYSRQGGGHHVYLATGDQRAALREMARLLGLALAEV